MPELTDSQRRMIHDLALAARERLTREALELLEGTYGLYPDGRLDPPDKLPQVKSDPETAETYQRLSQFLEDEVHAGLSRTEAVDKLVKEVAFTHLNRLVAFKMLEARKLVRGTLDRGTESNGFKFYLADPAHADDYARYQAGDVEATYRHFLLWQSAQIAQEVRVLFDPDTLASRLFPRSQALNDLLVMLNAVELAEAWRADETIGWVYQFFNEEEKAAVFDRLYKQKQKMRRQDIPAATQLFTPNWIVRFLVQNTLGRLWVQMHPDTRLLETEVLDYLVPLEGEIPPEPLRPISRITLLDPACGGMHFGLVAFDLFAAMYQEELERAGEPGWPEQASVSDPSEVAAAIIRHNLYGIDIDLRAVQLSALALYLKAKSLNPKARIAAGNLACADVRPLNGARLGAFLREARFTRPVYERLIRALWERLKDVDQSGSLLRLEREIGDLTAQERTRYDRTPLFAGLPGEFEHEAAEEEFWSVISAQIVQGLDEFARQQASAGVDQTFFAGEAAKGLRLVNLMLRRYDVVVTNPPYAGKRNLDDQLASFLDSDYPDAKGDLYTAFIQRCAELADEGGRVGMITQQSFMFLSSYEKLRAFLREQLAIETMAHTGPRAFAEISGEKVNTTAFCLRSEAETLARENSVGTYFRLVHAPEGDGKRHAFEQALLDGGNAYRVAQHRFDAIPGSPWVYRLSERIRGLFEELPLLASEAAPRQGLTTADNTRFIRYWWEVGIERVAVGCASREEAARARVRWYPLVKGGQSKRWYGGEISIGNWEDDGRQIKAYIVERYPYLDGKWEWVAKNPEFYFREGAAYSAVTSGALCFRWMPQGYICEHASNAVYSESEFWTARSLVALFNSKLAGFVVGLNETINVNVADLLRMPVCRHIQVGMLTSAVNACIRIRQYEDSQIERYWSFVVPQSWHTATQALSSTTTSRLASLETEIDDEIFRLYAISAEDRTAIEAELAAGLVADDGDGESASSAIDEEREPEVLISPEELSITWISYAVGVVLGRFEPGALGELGSSTYRPADFAVGSLAKPDEAEFDQLVGPPERFAYVDAEGGRHVFSPEVEAALRDLAVPDGITVLDEGHPRDLPGLVQLALTLMLGDSSAHEVITEGAGGDLRKFLERDYFTKWHLRWYRKRPVYWPLQSAKRSYGFVLFHERVDRMTLYTLQRDYLDAKLNGLRLEIGDLRGQAEGLSGAARRRVERQIDTAAQLLDEVDEFAQMMARIVREGYEPEPDWIDDGVILRMAPLWELIPIWKTEPRKAWERLQKGDYDWSHIAMRYWPERVKAACKTNKSFAIAHGHEAWYGGD